MVKGAKLQLGLHERGHRAHEWEGSRQCQCRGDSGTGLARSARCLQVTSRRACLRAILSGWRSARVTTDA